MQRRIRQELCLAEGDEERKRPGLLLLLLLRLLICLRLYCSQASR